MYYARREARRGSEPVAARLRGVALTSPLMECLSYKPLAFTYMYIQKAPNDTK